MNDFKGRHFEGEIVLWAVRWYCRHGISYRDLEEMMAERGVRVDHSTIYRWVQEIRTCNRKTDALAVATPPVRQLAGGRDLYQGAWEMGVSLPGGR